MTGRLAGNVLTLSGNVVLLREAPRRAGDLTMDAYRETSNTRVGLRRLSDRTLLLSLPSFGDAQAPLVDSALRAGREQLAATENLIIDVRSNGGGSDYVYAPVLPYLYTGPIYDINSSILSTPDNLAKFEGLLRNPDFPEAQKIWIRRLVDSLKANPGRLYRRPDDTVRFDKVRARPVRIAVVMDRGCGSSCEQFRTHRQTEPQGHPIRRQHRWSARLRQRAYPCGARQPVPARLPHVAIPAAAARAGRPTWYFPTGTGSGGRASRH